MTMVMVAKMPFKDLYSVFFVGFCYTSSPPARIATADRIRCSLLLAGQSLCPKACLILT